VYIKNEHINHYAFIGLERSKFVACTESKWDIHSFAFTSSTRTFRVLAESDRGPVIIEYGTYILATLFDIDSKYQETLVPLKNFIKTTTQKVYMGLKIVSNTNGRRKPNIKLGSPSTDVKMLARRELNINFLFS
jgi:hypothetical protein